MSETKKLKRWMIRGTLTTLTPLHIGDGSVEERNGQEVAAVVKDCKGQPYIPGSGLRGFLRGCAERLFDEKEVKELYGHQAERSTGTAAAASGGMLSVWDALPAIEPKVRVEHHVAINRETRAAADHLLYAEEVVEEGTGFQCVFVVEGLEAERKHVSLLLGTLAHLDQSGGRLGAGSADNLGKVKWQLCSVKELDEKAIQNWKGCGLLNDHLTPLGFEEIAGADPVRGLSWFVFPVKIQFQDLFLVQEPKAAEPSQAEVKTNKGNMIEAKRKPGEVPYLPGSALLGALRCYCEQVARTRGISVRDVTRPGQAKDEVGKYDPVDLLFGGVGLRGALQIEKDFVGVNGGLIKEQQLVAIDRFTGGAADSMLYSVKAFAQPILEGALKIDVELLRKGGSNGQIAVELLGITLREWQRGLIPLGYGGSKGFGHNEPKFDSISNLIQSINQNRDEREEAA